MAYYNQSLENSRNFFGIFISNLPAIIQLFVTVSLALGSAIGLSDIFYFKKLIVLLNLVTFFITTSFILCYLYLKNNPDLSRNFLTERKEGRVFLGFLQVIEVIAFVLFIIPTFFISLNRGSLEIGIVQSFAYVIFLVTLGLSVYIWFMDFLQKQTYLKFEDLAPKLGLTLKRQGVINDNIEVFFAWEDSPYRYFKIKYLAEEFFVQTDYNVDVVIRRMTKEEFEDQVRMIQNRNRE